MLLEFKVKNYLSIKEEVVLSFLANSNKEHEESIIKTMDERILPSIAIYGANAAGKSNIFKALTSAILLVRNSNNFQINAKLNIIPFLLDDTSRNEHSKIEFKFIYDGIKYEYGFEADQNNIYEEYLYEYKTSKHTMIFERKNINDYKFTSLNNNLKQYVDKNTNNKLFLCTATAWNCQTTRNAFMWFAENVDTYTSTNMQAGNSFIKELEKNQNNRQFKEILLQMLKQVDANITDYDFETREIQDKSKIKLPPGIAVNENMAKDIIKNAKEFKFVTHHLINTENGTKDYCFNIDLESAGTKLFFSYAPIILFALEKGKTIAIDEIDSCLHPSLLKFLINLFNDPKQNKNGAQLLFNTHDTNLLDLDMFRRDQIYFVEKNKTTGITDLYSLSSFSPRKTADIRKGYLQGKYGAIPAINNELNWNINDK